MAIATGVVLALLQAGLGVTLITFDVDGTLVRGAGRAAESSAHARAFAHSIGKLLGDGRPTALPADVLPPERYHGSTDGLIILNMARTALGLAPDAVLPRLPEIMAEMYAHFSQFDDAEAARGIEALPGVLAALRALAAEEGVLCGLVTGNVEGIARKKMRAVGVTATGALSPPHRGHTCAHEPDSAFLGGFGSDYCSGDIDDFARNHLDRAEQIAIAARRARLLLGEAPTPLGAAAAQITRVVHVGDAPSDVLAARACALDGRLGAGVLVSCIGVGTGRFAADELRALAGPARPGAWEPHVLAAGVADPCFLELALGRREGLVKR